MWPHLHDIFLGSSGFKKRRITVLWTMGAHSPGVNISVLYDEVHKYGKQFQVPGWPVYRVTGECAQGAGYH